MYYESNKVTATTTYLTITNTTKALIFTTA